MATKKRKKPTRKSPRLAREVWEPLLTLARHLVISNESNTDGWGHKNKMDISWDSLTPRPHGFPIGKLLSDVDGVRTLRYNACTVLDWLASKNYTKDTSKSIYKLRHYALSSLAKLERNLFNMDEKMLEELVDKNSEDVYSEGSEQIKEN